MYVFRYVCMYYYVSMYVFLSFVQGLLLVEILASGSGSGTPLFRTPVRQEPSWAMSHSNFLPWLSCAPLMFSRLLIGWTTCFLQWFWCSFRTLSPAMQELGWAMPDLDILTWLSCFTHKCLIWLKGKWTPKMKTNSNTILTSKMLIQDFVTHNAGAWLINATLSF